MALTITRYFVEIEKCPTCGGTGYNPRDKDEPTRAHCPTCKGTGRQEVDCDEEITLPSKYEVCDRCHGKGTHVNPSIDGHGITAEEFIEQGPDFAEDYFSGAYDVRCELCDGVRVTLVPDEDRLTPEQKAAWEAYIQSEYEARRERESEERWGY